MPTYLRDVLALPVVQAGRPLVLSGQDRLDQPVRWVHVSELSDIGSLLRGGELILTTGVALPASDTGLRRFVETLADADVCALVIELGRRFRTVPDAVVAAAAARGPAVIALRREVRFVAITENVHSLIVNEQHDLLHAAQTAHLEFTRLSIEGASAQQIIDKAAEMAGQAVVLEDLGHRALAYSCTPNATDTLLDRWEERSRLVDAADETVASGPEGWLVTPVGPRLHRWGRLIAPTPRGREDQLAMLLERAAEALAINRLVERDRAGLIHQAHRGLLTDLADGGARSAVGDAELRSRANALGLPTAKHTFTAVAIRVDPPQAADPVGAEARDRALAEAATAAAADAGVPAIVATIMSGQVLVLLSIPMGRSRDRVLTALAAGMKTRLAPFSWARRRAVGVGHATSRLAETPTSLAEAARVADAGLTLSTTRPRPYYTSGDVRLRGLLTLLRDDPRLLAFAEAELGPLLRHDSQHATNLTTTLRQYYENGGNKTALARAAHLSRPSLYARIASIERILGTSLTDPESATALHVAMLVHDVG